MEVILHYQPPDDKPEYYKVTLFLGEDAANFDTATLREATTQLQTAQVCPEDDNVERAINITQAGWPTITNTLCKDLVTGNYATLADAKEGISRQSRIFSELFPQENFTFLLQRREVNVKTLSLSSAQLTTEVVDNLLAALKPEADKRSMEVIVSKETISDTKMALHFTTIKGVGERKKLGEIFETWLEKTFPYDRVDSPDGIVEFSIEHPPMPNNHQVVHIKGHEHVFVAYTRQQYLTDNLAHIAPHLAAQKKQKI